MALRDFLSPAIVANLDFLKASLQDPFPRESWDNERVKTLLHGIFGSTMGSNVSSLRDLGTLREYYPTSPQSPLPFLQEEIVRSIPWKHFEPIRQYSLKLGDTRNTVWNLPRITARAIIEGEALQPLVSLFKLVTAFIRTSYQYHFIPREQSFSVDKEGRLHALGKPSIEYTNGEQDYSIHGIPVSKEQSIALANRDIVGCLDQGMDLAALELYGRHMGSSFRSLLSATLTSVGQNLFTSPGKIKQGIYYMKDGRLLSIPPSVTTEDNARTYILVNYNGPDL